MKTYVTQRLLSYLFCPNLAFGAAIHTKNMGGYGLGELTDDVATICAANCAVNTDTPALSGCMGVAPKHAEPKYRYLEGIDCKPLTYALQMR